MAFQTKPGLWARAAQAAAATLESRNRYVDFLRAVSIGAVITGHWLVGVLFVADGRPTVSSLLEYQPWTRWLTWLFQVMPIFFLVGGYSNGVSWQSATRSGKTYGEWLTARLSRLVGPVLPLIAVWAIAGAVAGRLGMRPEMIAVGSQVALVPVWFLAVYVMVVVLVPATYAAWQRFGLASFIVLALAAVADDTLFFAAGLQPLGWLNYAFIWVAVHQLGYAWRDGYFEGPRKALAWATAGAALLVVMVALGPYPVSMVSVPGEEVSNTLPPKLPMLALGIVQTGLLLSLEAPFRRWLRRATPWTWTVLVNGMIMTVFLWHLTASSLVIGLALLLGGAGLTLAPASGAWWAARPVWLMLYVLALMPLALAFGRFERGGAGRPIMAWRPVVGAALVCGGLALLALDGIAGNGWFGLRLWVLALPFVGAALAGVSPFGRTPVEALPAVGKLGAPMEEIPVRGSWEDLALPRSTVKQLRALAQDAREGRRISALFSGPSGTGKTMAAAVIADELGLVLYRVNLPRVVSKDIGETEKNLTRAFDRGEADGAVLLFDEADALFGKRSEIRDAHDRYANLDVDYLLQKIETYAGVTILATNLWGNIDDALLRRMSHVVEFAGGH